MGKGARKKGYIKNKTTGAVKPFMYNPEGISDSRATEFSEISSPGSSYPRFQYVKTGARTFNLELFLTTSSKGTVKDYFKFIDGFQPKGSRFSKPPVLIFVMGSDVRECIVTQVNRSITEFNSANLEPTKAVVSLALTQLG